MGSESFKNRRERRKSRNRAVSTVVKMVTAAATFTVMSCNNPATPEQSIPTYDPLVRETNIPQEPTTQAPNDEFADWKILAEMELWADNGSLGWCPIYSRDGRWPSTVSKDTVFMLLPNGDKLFSRADGDLSCQNGLGRWHPEYGMVVAVPPCREPQVSVRENPREIPTMGDR
jgi:hypothetical protein